MADYVGSRISLISNAEIRYEGILYTVDVNESTVTLSNVKSYGTEDRPTDRPVPPRDEVYAYIIFRGSDIKNVKLVSSFPDDPAIVHHSAPPPPSMPSTSLPPPVMPPLPSVASGMGIRLPFGQPPPPGPMHPVGAPPSGPPPMTAPPPSMPPPVSVAQAPVPSPRAAGWDVSLLPGGYPAGATSMPATGVAVPTSSADVGGFEFSQPPPPLPEHLPSQVQAPQPPPRSFSAAVGSPKIEKPADDGNVERAPRKAHDGGRDQPQAQARVKKEEPRSKIADDGSKAPGYRQRPQLQEPQQQPAAHQDAEANYAQNRQFREYRGHNDRRTSGGSAGGGGVVGGYHRNDQYGHGYRGGHYIQGGYVPRRGMFHGRGRGRGGLVGHLEPARQESRIKFDNEFDFETSNAEFENVKSKLADLSIGSNGAAAVDGPTNGEAEVVEEHDESKETIEDAEQEPKQFYDKEKSFFDRISCEALERQAGSSGRPDWKNERKLNAETFGVSSVRRPGGYWRGGRRGMGGRGMYRGGGGGYYGGHTGGYRGGRGGMYSRPQQGWGRGGNRPVQVQQHNDQ